MGYEGRCINVVGNRQVEEDPFLHGVYAAAAWSYDRLFGGFLGQALFEDAQWYPPPEQL